MRPQKPTTKNAKVREENTRIRCTATGPGTKTKQVTTRENNLRRSGGSTARGSFAQEQSLGVNGGASVTLTISELLSSMKKMTEVIEEHWKAMLHAAIDETARQPPLSNFNKAMVEIEVVTARGNNNAHLWDTSNRAINVIINSLKGIFF